MDDADSVDTSLRKLGEIVDWCAAVHGVTKGPHDLATEEQQHNTGVMRWGGDEESPR